MDLFPLGWAPAIFHFGESLAVLSELLQDCISLIDLKASSPKFLYYVVPFIKIKVAKATTSFIINLEW